MRILEADAPHAKVIIRKVAEMMEELTDKPFVCDEDRMLEFVTEVMASGQYMAFLAVDESQKPVGIITLGPSGSVYARGRFGIIHELYVDPGLRRRGIGKVLVDTAKQKSRQLGWTRLEVGTTKAKGFYLREGFQEVATKLKWLAEESEPKAEHKMS